VRAAEREISAALVIEKRRAFPIAGQMAPGAVGLAGGGRELASVHILVTRRASGRRRAKHHALNAGRCAARRMAFLAGNRLVGAREREAGGGVIEFRDVLPPR